MRRRAIEDASHISFPDDVSSVEDKVLFTLWREGPQCVANLGVLMGLSSVTTVQDAVGNLALRGKIRFSGSSADPLTICILQDIPKRTTGAKAVQATAAGIQEARAPRDDRPESIAGK